MLVLRTVARIIKIEHARRIITLSRSPSLKHLVEQGRFIIETLSCLDAFLSFLATSRFFGSDVRVPRQAINFLRLRQVPFVLVAFFVVFLEFVLPKLDVLVVERGTDGDSRLHALRSLLILFVFVIVYSVFISRIFLRLGRCDGAGPCKLRSQGSKQRQINELTFIFPVRWQNKRNVSK